MANKDSDKRERITITLRIGMYQGLWTEYMLECPDGFVAATIWEGETLRHQCITCFGEGITAPRKTMRFDTFARAIKNAGYYIRRHYSVRSGVDVEFNLNALTDETDKKEQ